MTLVTIKHTSSPIHALHTQTDKELKQIKNEMCNTNRIIIKKILPLANILSVNSGFFPLFRFVSVSKKCLLVTQFLCYSLSMNRTHTLEINYSAKCTPSCVWCVLWWMQKNWYKIEFAKRHFIFSSLNYFLFWFTLMLLFLYPVLWWWKWFRWNFVFDRLHCALSENCFDHLFIDSSTIKWKKSNDEDFINLYPAVGKLDFDFVALLPQSHARASNFQSNH